MTLTPLPRRIVDKPWGRCDLDPRFGVEPGRKVGEIWFEAPAARPLALMAKYLFTSERLSVQVHPGDALARARGHAGGKEEAWIVLDAEPDAEIGIGTVRPLDKEAVLAAARDGSIVDLIDWRRPHPHDFLFNPAGTLHALGAGLTIVEIQPAVDVTYRLFDYGRDRPLHLEEAGAAIDARPHVHPADRRIVPGESAVLVDGGKFGVAWCHRRAPEGLSARREMQLLPIDAPIEVDGVTLRAGEAGLYDGDPSALRGDGAFVLAWV